MENKQDVYAIGIILDYNGRHEIKYVTSVNNFDNTAEWDDGKCAMEFSKDYAKDVALGLCLNGFAAIPILKANYINLINNSVAEIESEDKI